MARASPAIDRLDMLRNVLVGNQRCYRAWRPMNYDTVYAGVSPYSSFLSGG
jgi:hypothetical protein